jgi:transposase
MIDSEVGEIRTLRLSPKTESIVSWVRSLPGPVAVAYEAGPTGFALARALAAAGVRCEVVAASSPPPRRPAARLRERAERADRRLHRRWARLDARGKRSTISAVAIARELAGWSWSLALMG